MNDKQVGIINEQGYFGMGFGFQEATDVEKEQLSKDSEEEEE